MRSSELSYCQIFQEIVFFLMRNRDHFHQQMWDNHPSPTCKINSYGFLIGESKFMLICPINYSVSCNLQTSSSSGETAEQYIAMSSTKSEVYIFWNYVKTPTYGNGTPCST